MKTPLPSPGMLKRCMLLASSATALAACVSSNVGTPETPIAFAAFITQDDVRADGTIEGFPAGTGTIVQSGTDGYVYYASQLEGQNVPGTLVNPGQNVFVSTAALLPGTNLGPVPDSGSATLNGTYQLRYVSIPSDRSLPQPSDLETASGTLTLNVNFADPSIAATTNAINGQTLTLRDLSSAGGTLTMQATYRGIPGIVNGKLGARKAVGAMAGASLSGQFSGGFIAE